MNYLGGKINIEQFQRDAFEESTLLVLCETPTLKAYKLIPKNRFHWCVIVDTGFCVVVGGDQGFTNGANNVAASVKMGDGITWFADLTEEDLDYMGGKFFGTKPGPKDYERMETWANDVAWMSCVQQEFSRLYIAHLERQEKKSKKKK